MMNLKLRLFHKALILSVVPALFTVLVAVAMAGLLNQAEKAALRENHSKEVVAQSAELLKELSDEGMNFALYLLTRKSFYSDEIDAGLKKIPSDVEEMKWLVAGHPTEVEHVQRIDLLSKDVVELMVEAKSTLQGGGHSLSFLNMQDFRDKASDLIAQLSAEGNALKDVARKEGEENLREKIKSRQATVVFLAGVVCFSVLLAVGLAWFFYKSTIKRLNILMDNNNRLASQSALNQPIQGQDEIAELDRTFHSTADKLAQAARIKQEFVSMISHDLRTPLTSIQTILDLIAMGVYGELSDRGQTAVKIAGTDSGRLIGLINDLLDVEKLDAGKMELLREQTPVKEVVETSLSSVQGFAEKHNVVLESNCDDTVANLDQHRIVQVLVNLLSNGIKYSPSGSTVLVETKQTSDGVRFSVVDNGKGIPESQRQTIFDRFTQVERSDAVQKGGTGLGLAICKAIVEAHGGQIGVDSQEGKGSTFWFTVS